ncbi:MAG: hypothetical protein JWO43_17 [Candidatus Adlerbacteria bacterium]|nr:hypothetical protein [Candidatus Adlerbacteria bacterium]
MAEKKKNKHPFQDTALAITRAIGSPLSIVIHTIIFIASFGLSYQGYVEFNSMLLILTTLVSLEAIYLSLFIQMTVNYTTQSLEEVEADIDEIQGDIDEIQEDVEEMQEDVGEIAEDVGEIQEDVDEIQEDVEEMSEEEKATAIQEAGDTKTLAEIHEGLKKLMQDIEKLQQPKN